MMRYRFPFYLQRDSMDCGPACLKMIFEYFGKHYPIEYLKTKCAINKTGVSMLSLVTIARELGLDAKAYSMTMEQLSIDFNEPVILYWGQNHYVILLKINKNKTFRIADPSTGIFDVSITEFTQKWLRSKLENQPAGIALSFVVPDSFVPDSSKEAITLRKHVFQIISKYRRFFLTVLASVGLASSIQMLPAFFTQAIIDNAIGNENISLLTILLGAQLMLLVGRLFIDFVRSRLLLFIGANVSVDILTSFWTKLLRLPLHYFDTKKTGDLLQRVEDHSRIEFFLTNASISALFSTVSGCLLSIVLLKYSPWFFLIFLFFTLVYLLWCHSIMKSRKALDYERFNYSSKLNSINFQLILGVRDIQLNDAGRYFLDKWRHAQNFMFHVNNKNLIWSQKNQSIEVILNESRNVLITLLAAKMVISGSLTLGVMISVQFVVGQLSSIINQFRLFGEQLQFAKISFDRLGEVTNQPSPNSNNNFTGSLNPSAVTLENVSFSYVPFSNDYVLNDINLNIPAGKVTAIVGKSGSGKSTLVKLLLRYYDEYKGDIFVQNRDEGESPSVETAISLSRIHSSQWYKICGAVLTETYLFNDSIANNISLGDPNPDINRIRHCCANVNLLDHINTLPNRFETKVGSEGDGLSDGQRQRLIIARLFYGDPKIVFLDEATNALDSFNENIVLRSLSEYLMDRTVIVVAHRLSTIKAADNIVVLDKGKIKEQGTHDELLLKRGYYFDLIKHQLSSEDIRTNS